MYVLVTRPFTILPLWLTNSPQSHRLPKQSLIPPIRLILQYRFPPPITPWCAQFAWRSNKIWRGCAGTSSTFTTWITSVHSATQSTTISMSLWSTCVSVTWKIRKPPPCSLTSPTHFLIASSSIETSDLWAIIYLCK